MRAAAEFPANRPAAAPMTIVLYGAVGTHATSRALANLSRALGRLGWPDGLVEVVDVFDAPLRAVSDGVLVTPTLVIVRGGRRSVAIGTLDDAQLLSDLLEGGG